MCTSIIKSIGLPAALVMALSACDLASQAKQVTVGDALTAADQVHEQRRNWRQKAQEARVAFLDSCINEARAVQAKEGWAAAKPVFDDCMGFANENMPELLVVTLSKELKEAYNTLSDEQIKALGLPPREDVEE